jgi:quinolinate synthase
MDKLPVVGQVADSGMTDEELEGAIRKLKKERNAVILAHYYQES